MSLIREAKKKAGGFAVSGFVMQGSERIGSRIVSVRLQSADNREAPQHLCSMRSVRDLLGEVVPGLVERPVNSIFPVPAFGDVVDDAVKRDISRPAIETIAAAKIFLADKELASLRTIQFADRDYLMKGATNGDVSPRLK